MATIKNAPICLIIMDGWGIGTGSQHDDGQKSKIAAGQRPYRTGTQGKNAPLLDPFHQCHADNDTGDQIKLRSQNSKPA